MRTRFAPSPTGPLHLGHAYSALIADDLARRHGGQFLLRIEDLDQSRARPEWEAQIYDDLNWLGLSWPAPVMRQSDRGAAYDAALDHLWDAGLVYPCNCSRRDIQAAVEAPQEGGTPLVGPDGLVYPGTCRNGARAGARPRDAALRLDMALACPPGGVSFTEIGPDGVNSTITRVSKQDILTQIGDAVVARRDMAAAYHLAVVVDDAAQAITHVVRGADLADTTAIHRVLQIALGLPEPTYLHHDLIRDDAGKRLAKRDDARAIAAYRQDGLAPQDVKALLPL